jgi:16S rRNA (cytidine1402-2'-O)-methyltransferase
MTIVCYESPHRILATLEAVGQVFGQGEIVVARELTKQFEEFRRGSVAELAALYKDADPKGEVVLVIAGAVKPSVTEDALSDAAKKLRDSGSSPRDVMDHLISGLGAPRNLAYKIAHESDS